MSIKELIWQWINEGRLVELRPRIGYPIRQLYIENNLYEELVAERDDLAEMDRFTKLHADLEVFVTSLALSPDYIKLLCPLRDSVWEIRSVEPEPQLRVFGVFAAKNTFIAMSYEDRNTLGDFDSEEWKRQKRGVGNLWRQLFNGYTPLKSSNIHKLVDGAINGKYFRDK